MLGTSLPSVDTAFRTRIAYTLMVWLAISLRASAVGHIPADIDRQTDTYRHIYTDIHTHKTYTEIYLPPLALSGPAVRFYRMNCFSVARAG